MPPQFYYVLHMTGILMLFMGYGALLARSLAGGEDRRVRRLGAITSGVGLIFILVAGFGLLSTIHGNTFHGWVIAKIVVWIVLGAAIVAINRKPAAAMALWWITLGLGVVSSILVYYRPPF